MKTTLSILIPTYNRVDYLKKLVDSVQEEGTSWVEQIELVIVIDGSTDNTLAYVEELAASKQIQVKYYCQKNSGKATALKKAIELATGEYVVSMDDDDRFINNGLDKIFSYLREFENYERKSKRPFAGFSFLTCDTNGDVIGDSFPESPFFSNLVAIRADHGVRGDKKEVIKTKLLKEVVWTVPAGEKRIATSVLWFRVARNYDVCFINLVVAEKDYLLGGLSKNIDRVRMKSPNSSKLVYDEILYLKDDIYRSKKYRLKSAINYYRYAFHSKGALTMHPKIDLATYFTGMFGGLCFYLKDKIAN